MLFNSTNTIDIIVSFSLDHRYQFSIDEVINI